MIVPKAIHKPSGKWQIQLRLGGRSVTVTESTEKKARHEAERIKAAWLADKKIAALRADNKTLKDACEEFIEGHRSRLSPTTVLGYEKIVRNSYQSLMPVPLDRITFTMLDKAVDLECKKPGRGGGTRSPKTIKNEYDFIAQILKRNGVELQRPRLPEVKRQPVQILSAKQVYSAVRGSVIELPCLLAMWMTLTISEIRGLTKSKSIRNGQLSIVETVVDIDGKAVRKTGGKEYARSRTLPIPPYIQELIDKVPGDIICPLSSRAVNGRLETLLKRAELPVISFHKLRHIAASTMVALNIPPAYVKAAGGWSSDHIMNTVYTHTYSDIQLEEWGKLDGFMNTIIATENATEK